MKKDYLVHYFKDDQKELINRKEISFRFLSIDYTFITADNVFSKDHVDSGSELLLTSALSEGLENDVLDYGCGYGVIGIVLSKHNYNVMGLDITDRALKLSEINAKINNVDFNVYKVKDDLSEYNSKFKSVLLNPPIRAGKEVIYSMFENAYNFLEVGGKLFIVMRKQHGALSAKVKLESIFDKVSIITKKKGYFIIKCEKLTS